MTKLMDIFTLAASLSVAAYSFYIMWRLPKGRDSRALAPIMALALAFFALRLSAVMEWEDLFTKSRDIAWRCWYLALFVELGLVLRTLGRPRDECGIGGASAVKRVGR